MRLRRLLRRIAITWLLCHAASLVLAPVAFALGSSEALLECRCTHGDHEVCPMHHKPAPGSKDCIITGSGDASAIAFSWLTQASVVPEPGLSIVLDRPPATFLERDATGALRAAPPDPPPPRL